MPQCGYRYTELGELKIYTRTNRNSFCLPEPQRRVLLFILDRTIGWHKVWKIISPSHFIRGVSNRLGSAGRFVIRGTGLTSEQVNQAVENLRKLGAIEVQGDPSRMSFRINELWSHPDLTEMWQLGEGDYEYEEDGEDGDHDA